MISEITKTDISFKALNELTPKLLAIDFRWDKKRERYDETVF